MCYICVFIITRDSSKTRHSAHSQGQGQTQWQYQLNMYVIEANSSGRAALTCYFPSAVGQKSAFRPAAPRCNAHLSFEGHLVCPYLRNFLSLADEVRSAIFSKQHLGRLAERVVVLGAH